jgi:hypothetical protein
MKKFVAIIALLSLSGCSFVTNLQKHSTEEYHNMIVNQVNVSSPLIKETGTLYTSTIPDIVTEKDEIDTSKMEEVYEEALNELEEMKPLLEIESKNEEQQTVARESITIYLEAAQQYLESFSTTLEYYSSGAYKEDITQVDDLDATLHEHFNVFIEANNDLSTSLETFVLVEEEVPVVEVE